MNWNDRCRSSVFMKPVGIRWAHWGLLPTVTRLSASARFRAATGSVAPSHP